MPLLQFKRLGLEECAGIHRCLAAVLQELEQLAVACNESRFKQAGLYGNVRCGFLQTFIDGANTVSDFETDIPECLYQFFEFALQCVSRRSVEQDQDINIRVWKQLATAVAANSHQCGAGRHFKFLPGLGQCLVDTASQAGQ